MTATHPRRPRSRERRLLPWLIALAGVIGSIVVFRLLEANEQRAAEQRFHADAQERALAIGHETTITVDGVQAVASFYAASASVDRSGFAGFTRSTLAPRWSVTQQKWTPPRQPWIQALSWIPRVTADERRAHEEAARRDGFGQYEITERAADGQLVRAGVRDEYFPVYFVEPYQGNEAVLGFDLASEVSRRETLDRARAGIDLAITPRIHLVQSGEVEFGFLAVVPVYRKGELAGFVDGVLRIDKIVDSALAPLSRLALDVAVYDDSAPAGQTALYESPGVAGGAGGARSDGVQESLALPVGGRQWRVVVTPTSDYLAGLHTLTPRLALSGALLLTTLLTAYLLLLEGRARRVEALVDQGTSELREANCALETEISSRRRSERELREHSATMRSILTSIGDGVIMANTEGEVVIFNQAAERIVGAQATGRSRESSTTYDAFLPDGVTPFPPDQLPLARAMRGGSSDDVQTFFRGSGCPRGVLTSTTGRPVIDDDGNLTGGVIVLRDITVQSRYEEELRQIAAELEDRNRELDDYTYSISHDLKEPLRTLQAFSHFLLEDLGAQLDEQSRGYLSSIGAAGARMQNMLGDLLLLSRVAREPCESAPVDVGEVIKEVIQSLELRIAETGAVVRVADDLPGIAGDAPRVEQIFRNLITNAIKFCRESFPIVEIGVRDGAAAVAEFYVRDNGIGIEAEYHDRIFGVFQRLNRREEYEGTGAGLAIVKRAVETLGGAISLESEPGAGTTFFVTLPLHAPRAATLEPAA